jgi:hypothetical protein
VVGVGVVGVGVVLGVVGVGLGVVVVLGGFWCLG